LDVALSGDWLKEDGGYVQMNTSGGKTSTTTGVPAQPAGTRPAGTYVADSFAGDLTATMGGTPALARDGEPAGLARVTMAMRPVQVRQPPAPRRLVGLCSWAALLGILGSLLALRAVIGIAVGAPSWYLPTFAITALVGTGATMCAFLTARARMLPWILLGAGTAAIGVMIVTTASAVG
jgi:hypothetical protein